MGVKEMLRAGLCLMVVVGLCGCAGSGDRLPACKGKAVPINAVSIEPAVARSEEPGNAGG